MNNDLINIPKEVGEATKNITEAIALPTAKSIGDNLGLLIDGVFGWIGVWGEKQKIKQQISVEKYKNKIENKLSLIPVELICEPDISVVGPALEASKYYIEEDDIQELFAELIASDCNTEKQQYVHPSFVEIIRQMVPDEAKVLRRLKCDSTSFAPLISLQVKHTKDDLSYLIDNYSDIGEGCCNQPDYICKYIDNLQRIGLISVLDDTWLTNDNIYKSLEESQFIKDVKENYALKEGESFKINKKVFHVTEFGAAFMKCCGLDK